MVNVVVNADTHLLNSCQSPFINFTKILVCLRSSTSMHSAGFELVT